jgi:hypothetical protein
MPAERVAIAGRRHGVVLLRGVTRGFTELDTVDARAHAIRPIALTWSGVPVAHTFDTFTDERQPFALPTPSPRC